MPNLIKNIKYDSSSGLIVFLVAVPLCLGIALSFGAPLFSGIISGIIGGIVIGSLSGSSLGVSGPTASVTIIVLSAISSLGGFETFLLAVIIGGVIQFILGILNVGILSFLVPSYVVKGMIVAVSIILFFKQIPFTIGCEKNFLKEITFTSFESQNIFSYISSIVDNVEISAISITTISLLIFLLWDKVLIKRKKKIFKIIQAPLVVVILGIVANIVLKDSPWEIKQTHLVNLPIAEDISDFFAFFTIPDFSKIFTDIKIYKVGIVLALITSLETLFSVEAGDKIDPKKRITPKNKELKIQGIGNILCGMIGGLPIAQVIVRTSVNVQSGGKTKMSVIFHGIFILISVSLFPNILNMIPLASLSSILLVTGYKMARPKIFKKIYKLGMYQFIPFMATIVGIIISDFLIGIMIGIIFGLFNILTANYRTPILDIIKNKENNITIRLPENVSFLNKGAISKVLGEIPANYSVIIDGREAKIIDYDIVEMIREFRHNSINKNITVGLIDISPRMPKRRGNKKHLENYINNHEK